jgi:DNA-directed RNA polymerase subunit RPC12/RpoP
VIPAGKPAACLRELVEEIRLLPEAGKLRASARSQQRVTPCHPMDRCHNCGQELLKIDDRGQRLVGCLTCNLGRLMAPKGGRGSAKKNLNALHELRSGGNR